MCTREECFERLRSAAPYIRKEFGVTSMRVFGSMARGDNRPDSDVDIFVEMPVNVFKSIELEQNISDMLGVSVDLICKHKNLNSFFLKQIERDGIYVIQ